MVYNIVTFFILTVLSFSFIAKADVQLTQEELVQWIMAGNWYNEPKNIYSLGENAGLAKHCPDISNSDYQTILVNARNWLKLASSESEGLIGKDGAYLNSRKYSSLLSIFNEGLEIGERDAKLMRRDRTYKRRICVEIVASSEELRGPSKRLVGLIRE